MLSSLETPMVSRCLPAERSQGTRTLNIYMEIRYLPFNDLLVMLNPRMELAMAENSDCK